MRVAALHLGNWRPRRGGGAEITEQRWARAGPGKVERTRDRQVTLSPETKPDGISTYLANSDINRSEAHHWHACNALASNKDIIKNSEGRTAASASEGGQPDSCISHFAMASLECD